MPEKNFDLLILFLVSDELKNNFINLRRWPDISDCLNLKIKSLCHTLTKAFEISRNTAQINLKVIDMV